MGPLLVSLLLPHFKICLIMGCSCGTLKAESPIPKADPLPRLLQSRIADFPKASKVPCFVEATSAKQWDGHWTIKWEDGRTKGVEVVNGAFEIFGTRYALELDESSDQGAWMFKWTDGTIQTVSDFSPPNVTWTTTTGATIVWTRAGRPCPNGHDLKPYVNPKPGLANNCNAGCGRTGIQAPEQIYRCELCDFDVCQACYKASCSVMHSLEETISAVERSPQPTEPRKQLALQNLAVLAKSISKLEKLQHEGDWGIQDVLFAVDPVYHHFYGVINAGITCPFMSAEEVVEYFKLAEALFPRWNKDIFETVGGSSQIHALCEIFEFLDESTVPIDASEIVHKGHTVRELVNAFREITFPCWIKARMFNGDVAAKDCLVTGRRWGLEQTAAYQSALERLLRNAEGHMICRYNDDNECCITNASRAGQIVRINFQYSGNKACGKMGPADQHDPRASVIGWETDNGEKTNVVTHVQISESTDTSIVGSMEFHNVPTNGEDLWFRFSGDGLYIKTYLDFDPPDSKLLPSYWNRSTLFPKLVKMGAGLSLRRSDNFYKQCLGKEHLHEIGANYLSYNMFCTQELQRSELSEFQDLFDASFRKKFTRDRKDGNVPDRLRITRGHRCQNVQNWIEYSRRRWQIKEELRAKKDLPRSINDLKTAGVFPEQDQYRLDSNAHEEFLFHGTNDAAADGITNGDFLVNLAGSNAGTLYGKGVYLAESVSKSDEYTKENARGERCILVCRATLGYVNYNDQISPNADALVKSCTEGPYHCVLGDREKCRGTYREIMVYDDDQVYPEYVIWYTRVYE